MKSTIRNLLGTLFLHLAVLMPNRAMLAAMCWSNRFLTHARQVEAISKFIRRRRPCHLLIFGLGHDSEFYRRINRGGRTIFLEDNEEWIRHLTGRFQRLEAYLVSYKTLVGRWRDYLADPAPFATLLPSAVTEVRWDIIFVDAPNGYLDGQPGRMESLRLAAQLVNSPGTVFVHDCERETEDYFSTYYLKRANLRAEIGNLRRYDFATSR
jgi:glucuronoxylan 4-O-methyltransferase